MPSIKREPSISKKMTIRHRRRKKSALGGHHSHPERGGGGMNITNDNHSRGKTVQ